MFDNISPLESIMENTLNKIKNLIDTNVVIGNQIPIENGFVIPISKVNMGFAVGGGEYNEKKMKSNIYPYASGTGGGVVVTPIGFLIVQGDVCKLVKIEDTNQSKLLDIIKAGINTIKEDK